LPAFTLRIHFVSVALELLVLAAKRLDLNEKWRGHLLIIDR